MNSSKPIAKNRYIVGKTYDWFFFILWPGSMLLIGTLLGSTPLKDIQYPVRDGSVPALLFYAGLISYAHTIMVFFRTHANPVIFKTYPKRFIVVPILLTGTLMASSRLLALAFVIAAVWNVYHAGLQVFGLGRIYDAKYNLDLTVGRKLDRNLLLVVITSAFLTNTRIIRDHVPIKNFVSSVFATGFADRFNSAYDSIIGNQPLWLALSAALLITYLIYYVLSYRALVKNGYIVSREKIVILTVVSVSVLLNFGLNPFGQATFIASLMHSVQYIALVLYTENNHVAAQLGLSKFRWGRLAAVFFILFVCLGLGAYFRLNANFSNQILFSIIISIALLHYWYDSFIWSVQKKQV